MACTNSSQRGAIPLCLRTVIQLMPLITLACDNVTLYVQGESAHEKSIKASGF